MSLKDLVQSEMHNGIRAQDNVYENTVIAAILSDGQEDIGDAYKTYQKSLNHFDIRAFRNVVKTLVNLKDQDREQFNIYADMFKAIPEYVNARNNFRDKQKEIFEMDGDNRSKQPLFDALDMNRTRAHNGVISLFNNLNTFANKNGIAQPYPNDGVAFDPRSPRDREMVADVLARQETLLENVNLWVGESIDDSYNREDIRSLSCKALIQRFAPDEDIFRRFDSFQTQTI